MSEIIKILIKACIWKKYMVSHSGFELSWHVDTWIISIAVDILYNTKKERTNSC